MEAVPRLPMISFELKVSTENVSFGPQLKQYIASFYNEDPESYNTEITNLEALRCAAVRPTIDVTGCQLLKKYYCQLHFLKSRFPMEESQAAAVYFSWKDLYSNLPCGVPDIRFELMCVLYNIGALHSQLGSLDGRTSPDGMKMACTHFQCAAWAFQTVKNTCHQMVTYTSSVVVIHFMQTVCLSQAQECILEKSMMDNRKATIIAKVAVQVVDYYKSSLQLFQMSGEDASFNDLVGSRTCKEWSKYLQFKISYHKCIALLYQGQQAEEQQKMGERVAFYQAACEQLEEARKLAPSLKQQKEIGETLAFTLDVVEGKRKAAKNENEFIYHEEVPEKQALQEVKGASLVKGIPFNVNDVEVSGPDIFARLVPMEAHEASSLYSEKKAQMIRQLGELVEIKDQALAEFMSSMQLELFSQMRLASGLSQDLVDRAAALSAKPSITLDLVQAMGKLSNSYHEVESMLNEIQELLKEEEQSEKEYQELMGKRPPSIIATDLSREAAKYREAHNKANDSNQNLHKAMTTHVANLKILSHPLAELQQQIPSVELPNSNVDENVIKEIDNLISKVDEMRNQRAMLWNQFREAVHQDDITNVLVTRQADQPLDQLFQQELQKHQQLASLIEQNAAAQENIIKAFVDAYARSSPTRRYLQDIISRRNATVSALITSHDTYEDLLAKASKGIEFYGKLETNVSKLLQRIKSACKVQQEEREQILLKNSIPPKEEPAPSIPCNPGAPKLKDYLDSRKKMSASPRPYGENTQQFPYLPTANLNQPQNVVDPHVWPQGVRPTPVGSEINTDPVTKPTESVDATKMHYGYGPNVIYPYEQYPHSSLRYDPALAKPQPQQPYVYNNYDQNLDQNLADRLSTLRTSSKPEIDPQQPAAAYYASQPQQPTYGYATSDSYAAAYNYAAPTLSATVPTPATITIASTPYVAPTDASQSHLAHTTNTTDSYQTISSTVQNNPQYPQSVQDSSGYYAQHYPGYSGTYAGTDGYYNNYYAHSGYNVKPEEQTQASYPGYKPNEHTATPTYDSYGGYNYQYPTSAHPDATTSTSSGSYTSGTPSTGIDPKSSNSSLNNYQPSSASQIGQYDLSNNQQYATAGYAGYDSAYYYATNPQTFGVGTSQSYGNLGQYGYGSNVTMPNTSAQVMVSQPQPQTQPQTIPASTKGSNVDLLTGLDFTVNQAPLIPQHSTSSTDIKEDAANNKLPKVEVANKVVAKDQKEVGAVPLSVEKVIHWKAPNNSEAKKLFASEIDKFEKFVDVLNNKTLSGPTNLDLKWKEIVDKQDAEKKAISVARCYPMKNRYPDILPYDHSRVELRSTKDDYINASSLKDISYYAPNYIITQAPVTSSIGDFWTMIFEQNVEIIVCLLGENEIATETYWPMVKGKDLSAGGMVVSLVNENVKPHWTERVVAVALPEKRESKLVMHLQFTAWPGSLFPTSTDPFVGFVTQVVALFQQQRSIAHPLIVHCSSGIGRSGLFALLMTAILEVTNNPVSIPDLISITLKLSAFRKNVLRDREHLKFAYESFLYYMKQILSQGQSQKVSNSFPAKIEEDIKPGNDDPLSNLDPFWASKKN